MPEFGKLLISQEDGFTQEFTLNKSLVTLGRSTTNDIVLTENRISRNHAQIQCEPGSVLLTDLNSSNGVWLNGQKVDKLNIKSEDKVEIGGFVLKYLPQLGDSGQAMTLINSESELALTLHQMTVPISLNDTSGPRLVIHAPGRTWEHVLDGDSWTIGRSEANDLPLDFVKISRNHARIERRGGNFILVDLQSTNGIYLKGQRIEQHLLKNGDTFQIGPVRVIFKSGFAQEELTNAGGIDFDRKPGGLIPVVFVPGMMGSELWRGSEKVWPNINLLFKNPDLLRYSAGNRLEPRGILNEMVIVPNLVSFDQYNLLGDYLVDELGYERGNNFIEFAYDWRQDVRLSARALARFVEGWKADSPIILIAHSLGTLVSRYYVEKLGGMDKVSRLILIGGPHQGAPKIAANLLTGVDLLPFGLMGKKLTEIIETFPSSYQVLPLYPCAIDQNGLPYNFFQNENWVKNEYRGLLRAARDFRRELGMTSHVPTLSIFGYGLKTPMQMKIQRDLHGMFENVFIDVEPNGDSSVPEKSAVLTRTEIHPVQQYHGTLFNDKDVKMRLKLELMQTWI